MAVMPMQVLAEEASTVEAWALFVTAPHSGWHVSGWYPSEGSAWDAAREYLEKDWADGVIVRRVQFTSHEKVRL